MVQVLGGEAITLGTEQQGRSIFFGQADDAARDVARRRELPIVRARPRSRARDEPAVADRLGDRGDDARTAQNIVRACRQCIGFHVRKRAGPNQDQVAECHVLHGTRDRPDISGMAGIDDTTNFVHGFLTLAVSIALEHKGRLEHAVVYDPLRQEFFTASRGDGAQLEGKKIRVSTQRTLEGSLIGTGFPFRAGAHVDEYLAMLKVIMAAAAGVRRPGAASLDLAYVAAGRIDGFWEFCLSPWDTAAGTLPI